MSPVAWILVLLGAAALVFWLAPSLAATALVFYGRHSHRNAMRKPYFLPYREEMDRCIAFFRDLGGKRVGITAEDGTPLSGVWYDRGSGKTVLMAHGYKASAMSNFCISGKAFWERGYNLLLIDQRAHGESGGHYSAFGLREQYDLLRWIDWTEAETDTAALAVYGISMGCAAMAYASDKLGPERVRAMVLDCGFTSPVDQLAAVGKKKRVPWRCMIPVIRLLARLTMGIDIDAQVAESLGRTRIPAFFLHGTADDTVSLEDVERNWAACASEKELALAEGAAHTMAFPAGGEELRERLFAFLAQKMQTNSAEYSYRERQ